MREDLEDVKRSVRDFWNSEACGERYGSDQDRLRYELEPEILHLARFDETFGLSVLEIGVGMGSDHVRFAAEADTCVGIDLTERAVGITAKRLQDAGLPVRCFVGDAEALPFPDESFDLVYSWGVLHHSPDTGAAIEEIHRVLRPGGQIRLMMYHRRSWVALAAWFGKGLAKGKALSLRAAVAAIESPGTKAFTCREGRDLLSGFEEVAVTSVLSHWDRKYAPVVSSVFGDRLGWFLLMEGRKPA